MLIGTRVEKEYWETWPIAKTAETNSTFKANSRPFDIGRKPLPLVQKGHTSFDQQAPYRTTTGRSYPWRFQPGRQSPRGWAATSSCTASPSSHRRCEPVVQCAFWICRTHSNQNLFPYNFYYQIVDLIPHTWHYPQ